jgi:hypothetical protein
LGGGRGGIKIFLPLDTHFPPEKKGVCGTQHKKQKCPRKKQAKVCGQTKIANMALSPSQGDATSILMHSMAYMIAQLCSGNHRNPFIQTLLFLLGRLGQSGFSQKNQSGQEIKYTQVPTTHYCRTNMTVVGTFLSWHGRLIPISVH